MTKLEEAAIAVHDYIWQNTGTNDDWPLQFSGDDDEVMEVIRLLNELQDEIKKSGYARIEYQAK
jgi:hypothetical protein